MLDLDTSRLRDTSADATTCVVAFPHETFLAEAAHLAHGKANSVLFVAVLASSRAGSATALPLLILVLAGCGKSKPKVRSKFKLSKTDELPTFVNRQAGGDGQRSGQNEQSQVFHFWFVWTS